MASISTQISTGLRRIIFVDAQDKRRTLHLGRIPIKDANALLFKVNEIVAASVQGREVSRETTAWLNDLPPKLRTKLERVHLVRAKGKTVGTVGELFTEYFKSLGALTPGTLVTYRQTMKSVTDYIGKDFQLRDYSPLNAERWRQSMANSKLSTATIARRIKTAKRVFGKAVKWKLVDDNPFDGIKPGKEENRARMRFIDAETSAKVMAALPDAEWRLIFALSRYGGLRCPSEHMALRWCDIGEKTITIHSSKTGERVMPLFPEIAMAILEYRLDGESDELPTSLLFPRRKSATQNLRTQLLRYLKRAKIPAWPKLFHNLRATRQTELAELFPLHVVCAWLGNSEGIARKHYLQTTDQHIEKAVNMALFPTRTEAAMSENERQQTEAIADGAIKNAVPMKERRLDMTLTGLPQSRRIRGNKGRPDNYDAPADGISDEARMNAALGAINAYFAAHGLGGGK